MASDLDAEDDDELQALHLKTKEFAQLFLLSK